MDFMEETQQCSNCKKDIPISKSPTHQGYCRRNIIKCTICQEMYDKNFLEEHQQEYHNTKTCQYCSKKFKPKDIISHTSNCDLKPKFCQHCELNVPIKEFASHLKLCQSRTSYCERCQKAILNKQLAFHRATCKGIVNTVQPPKRQKPQNPQNKLFQMEDSLTFLERKQPSNNYIADRGFKKQKQRQKQKIKQKQPQFKKQRYTTKQSKKQSIPFQNNKNSKNTKKTDLPKGIQPKKQYKNEVKNSHTILNDQQYNNYLDIPHGSPYQYQQNPYQFNQMQTYLSSLNSPQQFIYGDSFYGKKSSHQDFGDLSIDEQLIQQTIFQSSKKQKNKNISNSIPSDFNSEQIMNSSFYNDILDIQKQRAIQEEISSNRSKKYNKKR